MFYFFNLFIEFYCQMMVLRTRVLLLYIQLRLGGEYEKKIRQALESKENPRRGDLWDDEFLLNLMLNELQELLPKKNGKDIKNALYRLREDRNQVHVYPLDKRELYEVVLSSMF